MHHPLWVVRTTGFVVSESLIIIDAYIKACIEHCGTETQQWYVPPDVGGRNDHFCYITFNVDCSCCSIKLSSMHHPLWVVCTTSLFVVSESLILDAYIINKACIIATHHRDLVVHTTRCRWYVPPEVGGRNVLFYYNIFNVSFSRCSIRLP